MAVVCRCVAVLWPLFGRCVSVVWQLRGRGVAVVWQWPCCGIGSDAVVAVWCGSGRGVGHGRGMIVAVAVWCDRGVMW